MVERDRRAVRRREGKRFPKNARRFMHDGHGVTVAVAGKGLFAEVQPGEELLVALLGIGFHVIQQLAALGHELQEAAAG